MPYSAYNSGPLVPANPNAVGSRIGPVNLTDPFSSLRNVMPQLEGINATFGNDLSAWGQGQLAPATQQRIHDYATTYGITNGMPNANIFQNMGAKEIGSSAEQQMLKAMQAYPGLMGTISQTQTNSPALQYQAAYQNEVNARSPEPTTATNYAQEMFQQYMQMMQNPAGGTRGGGGFSISPSNPMGASMSGNTDYAGFWDDPRFNAGDYNWTMANSMNPIWSEAKEYAGSGATSPAAGYGASGRGMGMDEWEFLNTLG